jgi:hypothetical protein
MMNELLASLPYFVALILYEEQTNMRHPIQLSNKLAPSGLNYFPKVVKIIPEKTSGFRFDENERLIILIISRVRPKHALIDY